MALPREVGVLANQHYNATTRITRLATDRAQRIWRSKERGRSLWDWWPSEGAPRLTDTLYEAQAAMAREAQDYMLAQGEVQGFDLEDRLRIEGYLTPTADAEAWMRQAPHHATNLAKGGMAVAVADRLGLAILLRIFGTMVQDAGREATGVLIAAAPDVRGYYRKLRPPSCDRCAILAGAWYAHNTGFLRHPNCDCVHVPAVEADESYEYDIVEAIRRGAVTRISEAERIAILEEGADPIQVLQATRVRGGRTVDGRKRIRKSGLSEPVLFGRKVEVTYEGMLRGVGRAYVPRNAYRLTPNEIYRQAGGNRELLRQLLRRNGYLL